MEKSSEIEIFDDTKLEQIGFQLCYFDFDTIALETKESASNLRKTALELMDLTWRKAEMYDEEVVYTKDNFKCKVKDQELTLEWSTNF